MITFFRECVCFVLCFVALRKQAEEQEGNRLSGFPPLKTRLFFPPFFDLFPLGCPRRIISAFASADFAVARIFMGRCDLRTNIPMQTDSSRFRCCEGCELHANKLVSLMNQMVIFRNVLFLLVQMYDGLLKSSDWPFFVYLPSIKQVNALNWADTQNNNLTLQNG